jgi:hypothetical protein
MRLSATHKRILYELVRGSRLQDQRTLDGSKIYQLHPLTYGPAEIVAETTVEYLKRHKLISSNMKFPAATYLLTDKGAALAATLSAQSLPLHARNYTVTV